MLRKFTQWFCVSLLCISSAQAEALLLPSKDNSLSLSIYNQNLALIKDIRAANLKSGINEVIFDGVAQNIQAETAIIYGDGIKVNEQNYSYNLMSYDNFINQYIGQEVNTVRENSETGENIYERAILIGATNGQPILRFSYGIDAAFSGRVIFDKIPAGMSNKPMLTAQINANRNGEKNLYLAYLTSGLSWKTDYVANVRSNNKLDLTGWVTITNNSGVDYEKAKIQLIAGDINVVRQHAMPRMLKAAVFNGIAADAEGMTDSIAPETLNSYELYTLPNITTIKDKQTKQIALIEKNEIQYAKEFNLQSPFYFGNYDDNEFEKKHPNIIYIIHNTTDDNLGISLPAGVIRFYENDKSGNMQFIGSNSISNTAKEDTLRLNLGEAFNISVSGKIKKIKEEEISRKPRLNCADIKTKKIYAAEIIFNNAEDVENNIIFKQKFPQDYEIIKENFKSEDINATTRNWNIKVAKNNKTTLNFEVSVISTRHLCD